VVGDRLFCALKHFDAFTKDNSHFVVRHARTLSFEPDPNRPAITTQDASLRTVIEHWGWAVSLWKNFAAMFGGSRSNARRRTPSRSSRT
jgi:hypothetical protein